MTRHDPPLAAVTYLPQVPTLKEQIEWPRAANLHRQTLQQRAQMLGSWHSSIDARIFNRYTAHNLVLDVLTPLLTTISPPIR